MTDPSQSQSRAAVEAWESMFRAQSILFRRFAESQVWHGRTTREYDVLYQLRRAQGAPIRQRELRDLLYISQPSLSRMIDRLVEEGLINRCADPSDGRGALLSLSDAGRALQRSIGAGHAADIARTMRAQLTDEELRTLRNLTERLLAPSETATESETTKP